MKFRFIYTLFSLSLGLFLFYGNAAGPGEVQGQDRTGSPLSSDPCQACHNSGAFSPSIAIQLLDGQDEVNSYEPDKQYTLKVEISASDNPSAYGFQAVALSGGDDNLNAGTFATPPDGIQISPVNDRQYAEHSAPNTSSNTFEIDWIAPATGTGEVKIYSAVVAANLNSSSGGDGSVFGEISLNEGTVSGTANSELAVELEVFPNPVWQTLNIELSSQETAAAQMEIINLSGQIVYRDGLTLLNGQIKESYNLSGLSSGIYFLRIADGNKSIIKKISKR